MSKVWHCLHQSLNCFVRFKNYLHLISCIEFISFVLRNISLLLLQWIKHLASIIILTKNALFIMKNISLILLNLNEKFQLKIFLDTYIQLATSLILSLVSFQVNVSLKRCHVIFHEPTDNFPFPFSNGSLEIKWTYTRLIHKKSIFFVLFYVFFCFQFISSSVALFDGSKNRREKILANWSDISDRTHIAQTLSRCCQEVWILLYFRGVNLLNNTSFFFCVFLLLHKLHNWCLGTFISIKYYQLIHIIYFLFWVHDEVIN